MYLFHLGVNSNTVKYRMVSLFLDVNTIFSGSQKSLLMFHWIKDIFPFTTCTSTNTLVPCPDVWKANDVVVVGSKIPSPAVDDGRANKDSSGFKNIAHCKDFVKDANGVSSLRNFVHPVYPDNILFP